MDYGMNYEEFRSDPYEYNRQQPDLLPFYDVSELPIITKSSCKGGGMREFQRKTSSSPQSIDSLNSDIPRRGQTFSFNRQTNESPVYETVVPRPAKPVQIIISRETAGARYHHHHEDHSNTSNNKGSGNAHRFLDKIKTEAADWGVLPRCYTVNSSNTQTQYHQQCNNSRESPKSKPRSYVQCNDGAREVSIDSAIFGGDYNNNNYNNNNQTEDDPSSQLTAKSTFSQCMRELLSRFNGTNLAQFFKSVKSTKRDSLGRWNSTTLTSRASELIHNPKVSVEKITCQTINNVETPTTLCNKEDIPRLPSIEKVSTSKISILDQIRSVNNSTLSNLNSLTAIFKSTLQLPGSTNASARHEVDDYGFVAPLVIDGPFNINRTPYLRSPKKVGNIRKSKFKGHRFSLFTDNSRLMLEDEINATTNRNGMNFHISPPATKARNDVSIKMNSRQMPKSSPKSNNNDQYLLLQSKISENVNHRSPPNIKARPDTDIGKSGTAVNRISKNCSSNGGDNNANHSDSGYDVYADKLDLAAINYEIPNENVSSPYSLNLCRKGVEDQRLSNGQSIKQAGSCTHESRLTLNQLLSLISKLNNFNVRTTTDNNNPFEIKNNNDDINHMLPYIHNSPRLTPVKELPKDSIAFAAFSKLLSIANDKILEKEVELNALRQTMDHNETAIIKVYRDKETRWQHDLGILNASYEKLVSELNPLHNNKMNTNYLVASVANFVSEEDNRQTLLKELEECKWQLCQKNGEISYLKTKIKNVSKS